MYMTFIGPFLTFRAEGAGLFFFTSETVAAEACSGKGVVGRAYSGRGSYFEGKKNRDPP